MKENALNSVMETLGLRWFNHDAHDSKLEGQSLLTQIEEARHDWVSARAYFDSVLDPDLVEHAVYVNQAAEKRYMYLLKQAREQGYRSALPLARIE